MCALVMLLMSLVLVGWGADIPPLTRIRPTWPATTPWTALGLGSLAFSIALQTCDPVRAGRFARGLGIGVSGLGAMFLLEYLTSASFGLDSWLWPERVSSINAVFTGRPSPQTATLLVVMGAVTWLQRADTPRRRHIWIVLTMLTCTVASVSVLGYLFGSISPFFHQAGTGMGLISGLCFWTLAVAAIVARADQPPLAWVIRQKNTGDALVVVGLLIFLPFAFRVSQAVFTKLGAPASGAAAGAFAVSIAVVLGMTARLGSSPEDSWSDQTWLGSIGAVRLRLAVLAEVALPPEPPSKSESRDDEFLLRRLLAGEDPDSPGEGVPSFPEKGEPREVVDVDPARLLTLPEFASSFRAWTEEKSSAAVLDVSIDGLLGVEHALGRDASDYVERVLLRRMVDASHASVVACKLSENRVLLAQPTNGPWAFRVLEAVEKPILVDTGEVRVTGESPAATEVVDES